MSDLANGMYGERSGDLDIEIYEGETLSPDTLMYHSIDNPDLTESALSSIQKLNVADHVWTLAIHSMPALETRFNNNTPNIIAVTGMLSSLLVSVVVWMLVTGRNRAFAFAEAMNIDLSQENEKNRVFLRNSSDGIHILDSHGNIVEVSDSFCAMLGYGRDEVLGMNFHQWDAGIGEPELTRTFDQLLDSNSGHRVESRHRRKDGSVIRVEINVASFALAGQKLLFCSARDITERKLLEEKLAASLKLIQDLYNHAPCGYHSLDANGLIVHINDTELEWLGYSREDVVGKKKMTDFFTSAGQELFKNIYPRFMETGRIENLEYDLIGKEGRIRKVSASASAVKDVEGNFLMSRSVLYDISELKKIQKELQHLTLEHRQCWIMNSLAF